MNCIKTGCDLHVVNAGKWVHGDLHEVGGALVFNACVNDGEAAWHVGEPPRPDDAVQTNTYFERRGVIVLDDYRLPRSILAALPPMA